MNIKEVENLTGISKQNIRFYEARGLLAVKRNATNDYREYDSLDVRTLKIIKFLRTLDFSIEEIGEILKKNQLFNLEEHIIDLETKRNNLDGCIKLCRNLNKELKVDELDLDYYFDLIENSKKNGANYPSLLDDYKAYLNYKLKKVFSFIPNNMCMTKDEFTMSLLEFAKEEGKDITIIKESMYPEFLLDGYLYKAERVIGRYGAVVKATLIDENALKLPKFSKSRKIKVLLLYYLPVLIVLTIFVILIFLREGPLWLKLLLLVFEGIIALSYGIYYKNNIVN